MNYEQRVTDINSRGYDLPSPEFPWETDMSLAGRVRALYHSKKMQAPASIENPNNYNAWTNVGGLLGGAAVGGAGALALTGLGKSDGAGGSIAVGASLGAIMGLLAAKVYRKRRRQVAYEDILDTGYDPSDLKYDDRMLIRRRLREKSEETAAGNALYHTPGYDIAQTGYLEQMRNLIGKDLDAKNATARERFGLGYGNKNDSFVEALDKGMYRDMRSLDMYDTGD